MKYNNPRVSRSITNSGLRTMTISKPKYKFVTFTTGEGLYYTSLKQITITQCSAADDGRYSHADIQM